MLTRKLLGAVVGLIQLVSAAVALCDLLKPGAMLSESGAAALILGIKERILLSKGRGGRHRRLGSALTRYRHKQHERTPHWYRPHSHLHSM
jgi:hypothetical protein